MRSHDWPEKLHEVIAEAKKKTFEWGNHDCALFVFDCIQAMTEIDYATRFRRKYTNELSSRRALRKIEDVGGLVELFDKFLGERIELSHAKRGDVVILMDGRREVLGIIVGKCVVFLSQKGIQLRVLSECKFAWGVN